MAPNIRIKRVYEPATPQDGFRVLVDRVWPRGMTKEQVHAGLWLKEAAPSTELRKWFGHDPAKWDEFVRRYDQELDAKPETVKTLLDLADRGQFTLVYSAKDEAFNQAVALRRYLLGKVEGQEGMKAAGAR